MSTGGWRFSARISRRACAVVTFRIRLPQRPTAVWTYLAGPFLAFLPARWKAAHLGDVPVNWGRATLVSGLIESVVAIAALVAWYSIFVAQAGPAIERHFQWPYSGEIGLLSLYMHPLTWLICYFGLEGAVRMLAGIASEEAPGTLPLVLADRATRLIRHGEWRAKPALVKDRVERQGAGGELRIASCRPKDHWKYPLTIRLEGEFFQVQGEEHFPAARERPHVYRLKKLPANEIIRGLEDYDPESVLREEKPPGFFATVAGELRKKWS